MEKSGKTEPSVKIQRGHQWENMAMEPKFIEDFWVPGNLPLDSSIGSGMSLIR